MPEFCSKKNFFLSVSSPSIQIEIHISFMLFSLVAIVFFLLVSPFLCSVFFVCSLRMHEIRRRIVCKICESAISMFNIYMYMHLYIFTYNCTIVRTSSITSFSSIVGGKLTALFLIPWLCLSPETTEQFPLLPLLVSSIS